MRAWLRLRLGSDAYNQILNTLRWIRSWIPYGRSPITAAVFESVPTLGDAVVSGILESLRLFRRDQLLMAAINATHDHGAERYLIDPRSPMLQNMLDLWHDVFARGRAAGELRRDIADTELSSWLLGVHLLLLLLLLREDLDTAGQERMLRTFVLPGLHAR